MKKLIVAILCCVLIAQAQSMYIKGSLGYNMGMGGYSGGNLTITNTSTSSGPSSHTEKYELVNLNLGQGMNFNGAFGYMFNANIGTELAVGYQIGSEVEREYNNKSTSTNYSSESHDKNSISSNMLIISPSLLICYETASFRPYSRLGVSFGFGSVIETSSETGISTNSYSGTTTTTKTVRDRELEMTGGMAFGLNAALGSDYKIDENLALFAEINMSNLTYAPTEGKYTKYNENGVDKLITMTTAEKEFEYVDSYTYNSATPSSPNSPAKSLQISMPYQNAGITIGVKYSF